MSKKATVVFFVVLFAVFLTMNRGAYKGYFSDDEMDNLGWNSQMWLQDYAKGLVGPRLSLHNFRPVGHFYFYAMEKGFGLDFPKYAGTIHLFHLFNVWLLWVLARKLGASRAQASLAVAVFALHMGLFDALWKPMYVFDILCATFCLISLICYLDRRWVFALLAMWFAYKAKELAVMLPVVMLAYEWWLGKRRWKPLIPFFGISLLFGLQALILSPNQDNEYAFRFTLAALAKTTAFYSRYVFLVPYGGLALLAVPFVTGHRRAWFGMAMALFCLPLLFLPRRVSSAYCYLPFLGLAIALTALDLDSRRVQAAVAAALLLWIPLDYYRLRVNRGALLAAADEARSYINALQQFASTSGRIDSFLFISSPSGYNRWGIEGAIKYLYHSDDLEIRWEADKEAPEVMKRDRFAVLAWDWNKKKLFISAHSPEIHPASYVTMDMGTPVAQLGQGWYLLEDTFRWMSPAAIATLWRPARECRFQMRVNIGPKQMKLVGVQQVIPSIGGVTLAPRCFPKLGWQTVEWDLPPAPEGEVEVKFEVKPGVQPSDDPRALGLAIGGFGFITGGTH